MFKKLIFINVFLLSFNTYSAKFPESFLFGLATAPAHIEDELNDIWSDFAKDGHIACFHNQIEPFERIKSWSQPEKDMDLLKKLGVKIVRLGVDWQRLMPNKNQIINQEALDRYTEQIVKLKKNGHKVMLTLFHHSEPKWILKKGGWVNPETTQHFLSFAKKALSPLLSQIDYLTVFNEPTVYIMFTKTMGIWPGLNPHWYTLLPGGAFHQSLENMALAYNQLYDWIKEQNQIVKIGNANNIAYYHSNNYLVKPITMWQHEYLNLSFIKMTHEKSDFIGLNYYGAELFDITGFNFSDDYEYSDSGRAIYPKGLYKLAKEIYKLTNQKDLFITENGIADNEDFLRPFYILNHLNVVRKLLDEKINVLGYIHWTISDNLEWSDGYCPKFGLAEVDRANGFKRIPRHSFYVYQDIIKNMGFTDQDYEKYQQRLQNKGNNFRDFFRDDNGITALDEPLKKLYRGILPTSTFK